ncbi:hypothetical protein F4779DRAFT_206179 [Xylariaceae sp. FL0662B]|nr:hypothetical protein F4779DRAFT_206179 [Xylariaceae sp. FL0662B]
MTSYLAKVVFKKIFGEIASNKFGARDPYFEQVPATRLDGTPKRKFKKVRKALPPGLSEHDAEVLTKVKRRAYRLDMSFGSFLGLKFGWGSVLALFPVVGDMGDALLALLVIRTAKQIEGGLPFGVLLTMYFWVLVDFIVGLVPFVGDALDAAVLANTRNASILEDYLRKRGKKNLCASGLPVPDVDPSDPAEFDRFNSESPERTSDRGNNGRSQNDHHPQSSGVTAEQSRPSQPTQARVHDDRRGNSGGGFFGVGRKKSRPADVEMGELNRGSARNQSRRG